MVLPMVAISVFPEKILQIGGYYLSNTLATSILTTIIIILTVIIFKPKVLKPITYWIFRFTDKITEDRELTKKIFPLAATFLFFIGITNLLSILPGFLGSFYLKSANGNLPILRAPTSDINITLALALVSVIGMEYFSVSVLGAKKFFMRFFNELFGIPIDLGLPIYLSTIFGKKSI